ncbi:MAG: putative Exosome complex component RRP4 [Streblomastix strix]|uniref:Putative Exosome complex component RRP4 n=1 Tax=Streblomastix strix TaxID=222440 RepID=A0A5J4WTK7_9EUKA|nr:MAG: putative Exosome complex component RRP4 [Streblomastix strix]
MEIDSARGGTEAIPGEILISSTDFVKGHGTRVQDDILVSTLLGQTRVFNKFVSVIPARSRYQGAIGDVVIYQKQWRVDINANSNALLQLSGVNLPGSAPRMKDAVDELNMRAFLQEGDLISAEVLEVHRDGSIALHSRNLQYGRLENGIMVKVSPSLVQRAKKHFHAFPFGVKCIFGLNGYIWLSPDDDETNKERMEKKKENITIEKLKQEYIGSMFIPRQIEQTGGLSIYSSLPSESSETSGKPVVRSEIARLRNILVAMNANAQPISPITLQEIYDLSLRFFPPSQHSPSVLLPDVNTQLLFTSYRKELKDREMKVKKKEMEKDKETIGNLNNT